MRRKEAVVAVIKKPDSTALHTLTTAALVLPGLLSPVSAYAADGDEVDFQYSHFQEGKRTIYGLIPNPTDPSGITSLLSKGKNNFSPIEVDSLRGHANVSLTDRVKFAFNYIQDTWGGATPIATAPAVFNVMAPRPSDDGTTVVGATPYFQGLGLVLLDSHFNPLLQTGNDPNTFAPIGTKNTQLTHILSTASPETRNQGDFKLGYEWDEAALNVGGGISTERDYESRFGNIGGRLDLDNKRTTLNLDLSYTNSDTHATLNHDATSYMNTRAYRLNGQIQTDEAKANAQILSGNRQDLGTHFGISQILNKDALVSADVSYTRSTGYMANPYKAVSVIFIDPDQQFSAPVGGFQGNIVPLLEQRPNIRNQWNLGGRYVQYVNALDAAFHFDYHFSADDWGIPSNRIGYSQLAMAGRSRPGCAITPRMRLISMPLIWWHNRQLSKRLLTVSQ
jgi:Protein of unknown function (DUF3570)